MTYDKDEILNLLKDAPLSADRCFTSDDNLKIQGSNTELIYNYVCFNGATRFVLVPTEETKDFVIKIPYSDNYYCSCSYSTWDYCAAELERYEMAVEENMEQYFAKIEFVGYVNDYPIYVQEKCIMSSDYISSVGLDEIHKTISLSPYQGIDAEWLTAFRLAYGEEEFFKFINFVEENGWDDDLYYNVGFLNNLPIVVDYASFFEDC